MVRFELVRPDFETLGETWRALEGRAAASPFQTWSWVGCLAAERYTDPVLLRATLAGEVVALALCNRRGLPLAQNALHLGATGDAVQDSVFVEHNGPLIAREHAAALAGPCLRALLTLPLRGLGSGRTLVIGGGGAAVLEAVRTEPGLALMIEQMRPAPWVDLAALGSGGLLESVSSGTRYQLRRSLRLYAAGGTPRVRRAETVPEALAFLDALAIWHQQTWRARGHPGAFANPAFVRFHRALVGHGVPRGEVDLLAINFGEETVGYLYNLRVGDHVCNYQSGFNYGNGSKHLKPGMTSHHLAIESYRLQDFVRYDFLAGDDLYKNRLANAMVPLYWLESYRGWTCRRGMQAVRRVARTVSGGIRSLRSTTLHALLCPPRSVLRPTDENISSD